MHLEKGTLDQFSLKTPLTNESNFIKLTKRIQKLDYMFVVYTKIKGVFRFILTIEVLLVVFFYSLRMQSVLLKL